MKAVGGIRKVKLRGLLKVDWLFLMTAAAFNLWRIPKLKSRPKAKSHSLPAMNFALGGRPTRAQINPVRPQAFSNPLTSVSSSAFQQAPNGRLFATALRY